MVHTVKATCALRHCQGLYGVAVRDDAHYQSDTCTKAIPGLVLCCSA